MKGAFKQGLGLAAACLLVAVRVVTAGEIVVDDADQTRTYDCAGGNAVVNTGDNVLTFKNCGNVVINGGDNQVDAGTARTITVHGSGNRVTWTKVAGSSGPKVVNMGSDNVVSSSGNIVVRRKDGDSAKDLEAALGTALADIRGDGNGQVSVSGDGTVRVEGSGGGTVEVTDSGITARSAKDIVVRENNRTETLDCAGGSASVDGNSSVLTLRGCRKVTVNGNGNKLEVAGATAISLLGNGNEVGWSPGAGGVAPTVSDLGKKNAVTRRP